MHLWVMPYDLGEKNELLEPIIFLLGLNLDLSGEQKSYLIPFLSKGDCFIEMS